MKRKSVTVIMTEDQHNLLKDIAALNISSVSYLIRSSIDWKYLTQVKEELMNE